MTALLILAGLAVAFGLAAGIADLIDKGNDRIEAAVGQALDEPNCTRWDYGVRRSYSLAIVTRRDVA